MESLFQIAETKGVSRFPQPIPPDSRIYGVRCVIYAQTMTVSLVLFGIKLHITYLEMPNPFTMANSTYAPTYDHQEEMETVFKNLTFAPTSQYVASFFPSGLGVFGSIGHFVTHPKVKDWIQLIALGLVAEFTRRLSKCLISWARQIFCITSTHCVTDDAYHWLMGEVRRMPH